MKTKSLFILSLIIISTHNAFCASGGIDIQKVLDAGGEVIIRSADGGARNVSVSKKKNNSSNDDPFKVEYNDAPTDSGNADEEEDKEKESSIAENTAESIVASNDDLFELDDSDSQTVSVSDFETKALDSDFEAITLIEKSKFGDKIDSCNDVNANSDRPYIKCDIKNSTKKYKFYFKSIGGAAKEPELTNLSDTKSQKKQQLRQDAQSILTAFNEQKEKLKNK